MANNSTKSIFILFAAAILILSVSSAQTETAEPPAESTPPSEPANEESTPQESTPPSEPANEESTNDISEPSSEEMPAGDTEDANSRQEADTPDGTQEGGDTEGMPPQTVPEHRGPPPGCREERDETGFVRVICEGAVSCQPAPKESIDACRNGGGMPQFSKSPNGCDMFYCQFDQGGQLQGQLFKKYDQCPSREQIDTTLRSCESSGLKGVVRQENGCGVASCIQTEQNKICPSTQQSRVTAENECSSRGLSITKDFDQSGCIFYRCAEQNYCRQNVEDAAYSTCHQNGGEMIVKRDRNGCVSFAECVRQGDENDVYVERPSNVPDSTEVLSIAFKLEKLVVELDKLSKQADDVADYYKSTGSTDENRFRRVADMFQSAKGNVQDIKDKMKERLDTLTIEDMTEIKHDIKYLKDVAIKDIVYVMLSSNDDVQNIVSGSGSDCGTDERCFDKAIRICSPVKFLPEGRNGPTVEITGLEDNKCILQATMTQGSESQSMTCKIEKYSLGIRDPETDVLPYCEGPLYEMMKQEGVQAGGAVEGVCQGEDCKQACFENAENAKKCLDTFGNRLPPEAKQGLTALIEGRSQFQYNNQYDQYQPIPQDYRSQQGMRRDDEFRTDLQDQQFGRPPPGNFRQPGFSDEFGDNYRDPYMPIDNQGPGIQYPAQGDNFRPRNPAPDQGFEGESFSQPQPFQGQPQSGFNNPQPPARREPSEPVVSEPSINEQGEI
ncbi:MAG: hypothetical protein HY364_01295 [Candidatus Aenigmarchaeota archaeon]|nr:hypothetical protein [Candidatus Aenigmarchaeota archaeon]